MTQNIIKTNNPRAGNDRERIHDTGMKDPGSPFIPVQRLDELHALCNRRCFVHPDPLEFLYDYPERRDRELVGLIASSLAYGRVAQILKSIRSVLKRMKSSPFLFLVSADQKEIFTLFSDFRHRFTTGEELSRLLWGARGAIEHYGSLYNCFVAGLSDDDPTVLPALSAFVQAVGSSFSGSRNSLLPSPIRGSACKRLNLFLRWMVRQDDVDPGGWHKVPPSKLVIPLDTHMHRICLLLKVTGRKQADMRTALEITRAFGRIAPDDPVRYDFVLTRLGIRDDMDLEGFLRGTDCLE
jgi:uncharacterized protein (TIGR02757 family)